MKRFIALLAVTLFTLSSTAAVAHTDGSRMWDGKKKATIKVIAQKDMMSGYNIRIKTKNFKWAPERASMAHRAGEGHAHIYVDEVKVARVYGEWFHLSTANLNLSPGTHVIRVDLNGNDHVPYMVGGKHLEDSVSFTI